MFFEEYLYFKKKKTLKKGKLNYKTAKSLQSYPTLCDSMDCSLPGSSIHGTFQARALEWDAFAFSINDGKRSLKPRPVPQMLMNHLTFK